MIQISKELIEKYHTGQCTSEEREAVEEWLFSDEVPEDFTLPPEQDLETHKADIWNDLKSFLPEEDYKEVKTVHLQISAWKKAVAACLILGLIGITVYQIIGKNQHYSLNPVSINNTSLAVQQVYSKGYNISVGPGTLAKINYHTGMIDFSGIILISPKRDIELTLGNSHQKTVLKVGQTYIALKDRSGNNNMIIVSERNLMDLPPALQKQLIHEFNI